MIVLQPVGAVCAGKAAVTALPLNGTLSARWFRTADECL